jgi:hypothetical protein
MADFEKARTFIFIGAIALVFKVIGLTDDILTLYTAMMVGMIYLEMGDKQ